MDFAGPTATRLRSIGRKLGVFPPLVRAFRKLSGAHYEERFDAALLEAMQTGDVVWDVGANVGLYTDRFAQKVGSAGSVLAFEPSPKNVARLRERFQHTPNVTICPVALAEHRGVAAFYENGGNDGTTDSMVARGSNAIRHEVDVRCGEDYLDQFPPNVIKIDVEGFELEALRGLQGVLTSPRLRSVLIEVHFGILSDRGLPNAPAQIAALLQACGMKISWIDASHLLGTRADAAAG